MKYKDYLKSDHWKEVKDRKRKSVGRRCAICASFGNIHLHHLFYRGLFKEELSDLRWLCEVCHNTAHKLINSGIIKPNPNKPFNHHSIFAITKYQVKKELKLGNKNMFNRSM